MHRQARRSPSAILLLTVLLEVALACSSPTNAGEVPHYAPFTPDGRLVGGWNVIVFDTVMACAGSNCSQVVLETNGCLVTTDLTTDPAGVFSGTLSIDSVRGSPSGTGACSATMAWPTFARTAMINGGVSLNPPLGNDIAFQIGDGSAAAIEALVGCPLATPSFSFRMFGNGWMGDLSYHYPGSAFIVRLNAPGVGDWIPFLCHGRKVLIEIDYSGELKVP